MAVRRHELRAPTRKTISRAADEWLDGAKSGAVRTRSGDVFKPSTVRGYEGALRTWILPRFGPLRLSELHRGHIQDLVERMLAKGLQGSTVRNVTNSLRVVLRRELARGEIAVDPCAGITLPASRGRRDRVATPAEVEALIAAVPAVRDRAIWGTAMYAGLRAGEIRALRWEDVDLDAGLLRVERSWDDVVGPVDPKSRAGRRSVPIAKALRGLLAEHRLACEWSEGLAFGRTPDRPFDPTALAARSRKAWTAAELDGLTLHEGRHVAASLMVGAGLGVKEVSSYLGHATVALTLDRYAKLVPGSEVVAVERLDAYLGVRSADTGGSRPS